MVGGERVERALGLLVGTVAATGMFLASFFILFGRESPSGLFPVFVTVTVILALIPGLTAGIRLAFGFRGTHGTPPDGLDMSLVIRHSMWSAIIINAIFAGLGMVASMGMLVAVLLPYLLVASALLVGVSAALGWAATRLVTRFV